MKHLSGLDASFLFLETPQMPMHVGAMHLFELPADYAGEFAEDLRAHIAARLALIPALRRRLASMPLNLASPVWVDAEPDLAHHIVSITLPPGSGKADVERQVGLLHPVLLDRTRPLWKFHVFDGLASGPRGERRVGLYSQFHHAAVDGQAAVALAQVILDLGPQPREIETRPSRAPKGQLGMAAMLRAALANQMVQIVKLVKVLPAAADALGQVFPDAEASAAAASGVWARLVGVGKAGAQAVRALATAPRTRLNVTVSSQRAFAGVSLPLAELNAARRRHKASLNDAVLMICSTALRRHFARHGPLPRKPMRAAMPVSLRAPGDTASNNQASMSIISLGTHLADPARRWAHVRAATASMKSKLGAVKSLLPTDFPSLGVPWLLQGMSALYGRAHVAERVPPIANVTISNVPGPTVPLYLAGAKMLCNYPTSIVVHGVALNITVQTYNDALNVGIIACARAMPEVAEFAADIEAAFKEFLALVPAARLDAIADADAPATDPAVAPRRTSTRKFPAEAARKAMRKTAAPLGPKKQSKAKSVATAAPRTRASASAAKRAAR